MSEHLPGLTRDRKTSIDKIRDFVQDTRGLAVLSEVDERIFQRLKGAWVHMIDKGSSPQATAMLLMELHDISYVQARMDVKNAISIFGDASRVQKEGMRQIIGEGIMRDRVRAAEKEDWQAVAKFDANLIKIFGLDKEDPDLPDFAKLEPHVFIIAMPESQMENLKKMLAQPGTIDLNQVEDAEFEELKN